MKREEYRVAGQPEPLSHYTDAVSAGDMLFVSGCVPVDGKGFVKTGIDLQPADLTAARWPLARSPYPLETALPAVFAVGDVRAASVKRVAAAVGEGSACVQLVHKVLQE